MQEEVWNKAQADTDALKKLYDSQPSKYYWKPSADVAIFFSSDADIAKKLYSEVSTTPNQWKTLADKYPEIVIADSGRYEWSQIPNLEGKTPSNGMITKPIANNTDNTTSFAYIIKTYKQATQRSFTEARGLVINDYQEVLEKQLDEKLRKKYPVVVNEKVLKGLVK